MHSAAASDHAPIVALLLAMPEVDPLAKDSVVSEAAAEVGTP